MNKIIINDQLLDEKDGFISINDRGFYFGDGVYDVIRVWDAELFLPNEHINRFFNSAAKIEIEVPFTKEELLARLRKLMKENNVQLGTIYFQLTRGSAPRIHQFPSKETKPTFIAFTTEKGIPENELRAGVEVVLKEDIRNHMCDVKSINLLPNILAKQFAKSQGCFEAVLHRGGIVTEGSSTNIFIVKDEKIITHPTTNLILNGITRQLVIELAEKNNIPVIQREFKVDELMNADEVFLTSTTSEVMPIIKADGKIIGEGIPGKVTRKLQKLVRERILHDVKMAQQK